MNDCIENPQLCQDENTPDDETEATDSSSVSMGSWEYIKILIALVFVLGLLLFVLKFLNKRNSSYQQNSVIRNIGGMSVGPQKSVQLVQISNRIYVLGVGENIHLIKEISAPEDVEQLLTQFGDNQLNGSTTPYIAELFKKFSKKNNQQMLLKIQNLMKCLMNVLTKLNRNAVKNWNVGKSRRVTSNDMIFYRSFPKAIQVMFPHLLLY